MDSGSFYKDVTTLIQLMLYNLKFQALILHLKLALASFENSCCRFL